MAAALLEAIRQAAQDECEAEKRFNKQIHETGQLYGMMEEKFPNALEVWNHRKDRSVKAVKEWVEKAKHDATTVTSDGRVIYGSTTRVNACMKLLRESEEEAAQIDLYLATLTAAGRVTFEEQVSQIEHIIGASDARDDETEHAWMDTTKHLNALKEKYLEQFVW